MRVVAFILARAGSKGLPGKNIRPLGGRPLLLWSAQCAQDCGVIDEVFVSTDGPEIAKIAQDAGVKVLTRPDHLSDDQAMPKDAIRYHLAALQEQGECFDIVILLQPTSPLRAPEDIQSCVAPLLAGTHDSAATFQKSPLSPFRAWRDTPHGPKPFVEGFDPWKPRQALDTTYALNGAVYAARLDVFLADPTQSFLPGRAKMVLMPPERSVDIDTLLDFEFVETVLAKRTDKN